MTELGLALALRHGDIAACGVFSAMVAGGLLLQFGEPLEPLTTLSVIPHGAIVLFVALLFACVAIRAAWRQMRQWPALLVAFAGMNGLVILVFLMWVQLDLSLTFARISAFVLVALVALALAAHLKRRQAAGLEIRSADGALSEIVDRQMLCMNTMSGDSGSFRAIAHRR